MDLAVLRTKVVGAAVSTVDLCDKLCRTRIAHTKPACGVPVRRPSAECTAVAARASASRALGGPPGLRAPSVRPAVRAPGAGRRVLRRPGLQAAGRSRPSALRRNLGRGPRHVQPRAESRPRCARCARAPMLSSRRAGAGRIRMHHVHDRDLYFNSGFNFYRCSLMLPCYQTQLLSLNLKQVARYHLDDRLTFTTCHRRSPEASHGGRRVSR